MKARAEAVDEFLIARPRLVVRNAQIDDVDAIAALVEDFAKYMRELGDTSPLQLNALVLKRDGFGEDPAFDGLVAELDGVLVGYLLYHQGYDTDAACRLLFVVDLFVAQVARGMGCGMALMDRASAIARAKGVCQLVWTVDRRNLEALKFYTHIGGQHVHELDLMCMDV